MKKNLLVLVMSLAAVATLAGCDKKENNNENNGDTTTTQAAAQDKKLTCEMTEEQSNGVKNEIKYIYTYKNDKISFVTLQGTFIYKDKYDEKEATKLGDECNKDLKDQKGVTCNVQKTGSRIYVTYQYTIDKLDDNGWKLAEEAGIKEVKDFDYDKLKSTMEAATFTCK